jgi:hypothetical protein
VISGGVFEGGEFEDYDFFDCGTFQDLVASLDGAKFGGLFKATRTSWRYSLSLGIGRGFFAE